MTPKDQWSAVDRYICDLLVGADPSLDQALADSAAAGLPNISVSPNQGKLLHILARTMRASRILEIGTLGGYSTIWLGRAVRDLRGSKVVTLEYDPKHVAVAKKNIERAGLGDIVEIRVGAALDTLPKVAAEMEASAAAPFDLVFIDADKVLTAEYFQWSLKLTRPGSIIVADNVVRNAAVIDESSKDQGVLGIRRFNENLAKESRVIATAVQTVGSKGYDGFAIAIVK